MKNEIVVSGPLMVQSMTEQVNTIQLAMKELMKDGVHYGKIPGCGDKPALLKPGAEKISFMFRLVPRIEVDKEELSGGHREITVTVKMYDNADNFLGDGVGSCSTMESKYRWRNAGKVCPSCGNVGAIFKSKFDEGGYYCNKGKGGCGRAFKAGTDGDKDLNNQKTGKVENPDIADQYNTVLKMAKKRALVDAILTVTAASDVFEQDLDEFGEADLEAIREEKRQKNMKPKTEAPKEKKPEAKKTPVKKQPAKQHDKADNESGGADLMEVYKAMAKENADNIGAWWVEIRKEAMSGLGLKKYNMLEKYLADVHGLKLEEPGA